MHKYTYWCHSSERNHALAKKRELHAIPTHYRKIPGQKCEPQRPLQGLDRAPVRSISLAIVGEAVVLEARVRANVHGGQRQATMSFSCGNSALFAIQPIANGTPDCVRLPEMAV